MADKKSLNLIRGCLKHIVCTRNENENSEEYEKGVIEPYNEIKEIYDTLVKENSEPTFEQMETALNNLMTIFKTKKVPESEQTERIETLLKDMDIFSDEYLAGFKENFKLKLKI